MTDRLGYWFERDELAPLFERVLARPVIHPREPGLSRRQPAPQSAPAESPPGAAAVPAPAPAPASSTTAIEARLRHQQATLMALARSETLGSRDPLPALQRITHAASETLHVARVSVWLYGRGGESIVCRDLFQRATGAHEAGAEILASGCPRYFAALREERSIAAHDAHADPRTNEFSAGYLAPLGISSMLDAPIRVGGKMVGVLCHEHTGPARQWSADEEQFAAAAADVAALALEASERRAAEEERAAVEQRLRGFSSALMALARSEAVTRGELDEAMREITRVAAQGLGCERSSVWQYNPEKTAIYCLELYRRSADAHESGIELRAEDYPGYFAALREDRTIAAHDAHVDPRTSEFSAGYLTPLGINSMLDAPIRVGGRMMGVICNEHTGGARKWTAEEEQFAASIADFVALATEASERKQAETELRIALTELQHRVGEGDGPR